MAFRPIVRGRQPELLQALLKLYASVDVAVNTSIQLGLLEAYER